MIGLAERRDLLLARIMKLNVKVWEHQCEQDRIDRWLSHFEQHPTATAEEVEVHALHLLSEVSYFGLREMRVLLRTLYRDVIRQPIVRKIRLDHSGTTDSSIIDVEFRKELDATRILGIGTPAESGTHLLYYFRQENRLSKNLFVSPTQLFDGPISAGASLAAPDVRRLIFIDDFCGSGVTAIEYGQRLLPDLRDAAARSGVQLSIQYLTLFGTQHGLEAVRNSHTFDLVEALSEFDETDKSYEASSRILDPLPEPLDAAISREVATSNGIRLSPYFPLGFDNDQLLLAFHHNTPDNSLPIIWYDDDDVPWEAPFPRYPKRQ